MYLKTPQLAGPCSFVLSMVGMKRVLMQLLDKMSNVRQASECYLLANWDSFVSLALQSILSTIRNILMKYPSRLLKKVLSFDGPCSFSISFPRYVPFILFSVLSSFFHSKCNVLIQFPSLATFRSCFYISCLPVAYSKFKVLFPFPYVATCFYSIFFFAFIFFIPNLTSFFNFLPSLRFFHSFSFLPSLFPFHINALF
ncbi:unnamed protein product [Acanthosepion pharaonis]|uniref:Uncharacterized protein n=1 Tax=Acanthosepion pharaonis TaxID=158019 RepID=A0A812DKW5_ACAPH|nr:unnamed protein product [Sepia pharaonis]